jgi:folate-binding protein YgfZ
LPPPPAILPALLAMTPADLLRDLLPNPPYQRHDAPYRLLQLTGPDAGEFLHRLCSQDVLGLAPGSVRPAAFLDAKGKLLATCLVFRGEGAFWLEVAHEQADRLAALLERYHFTEKLVIARPDFGPCHETVQWASNVPAQDWSVFFDAGRPVVRCASRLVSFTRSHGAALAWSELHEDGSESPLQPAPLSNELAECVAMAAGIVRVGVDTEPTTLALEADLDDHISTTKGCYTGQEIVARIHTYGHTNRKLCLLRLAPGAAITAPQPLHEPEDDLAVGRVMRAVVAPGGGCRVGLGFLPKDFQAPGSALRLADGTAVEVVG